LEMRKYYFAFSDHPLVVPYVYVNDPAVNQTWISSALCGDDKKLRIIAKKIISLREEAPFTSFEDMQNRLVGAVDDKSFKEKNISKDDINRLKRSTLKFNLFSKDKVEDEVEENKDKRKNTIPDLKREITKRKKISCKCAKSHCSTNSCNCKKNGVKCSPSCRCKDCTNGVEEWAKKEQKEKESKKKKER